MTAPLRTRTCAHCGETFSYKVSRGTDRKYCTASCRNARHAATSAAMRSQRPSCSATDCSRPCRSWSSPWCEMHYYRMRRNGSLDRIIVEVTGDCRHCGKPTPRRQRVYCSSLCQRRHRLGVEYAERRCLVCSSLIAHEDNYLRRYCGAECQGHAARIRRYGMSLDDFRAMHETQAGQCAICRSTDRLVIDHCHGSNTVRGLLCGACNAGIGMLRDDPEILVSAIKYLQR